MKKIEKVVPKTLRNWEKPDGEKAKNLKPKSFVDCGWGKIIFGHTFDKNKDIVKILSKEKKGKRDIAFYIRDPHVILSVMPNKVFLDPSHTYRIWFENIGYKKLKPSLVNIRGAKPADEAAINLIYNERHMVPLPTGFIKKTKKSEKTTFFVAEDAKTKEVVGVALGVDHVECFNDPEMGSSLWSLGVRPHCTIPKVGEYLVRHIIGHFISLGRAFLDVSVMHDNRPAIKLYEKLGFYRTPVFCVKNKNPINEPLYISAEPVEELNIYAKIIVDEARKRGIDINVLDAKNGYFELKFGGKKIVCRESLSQLTDAVAMSRCDDKHVTVKLLDKKGLNVPDQVTADSDSLDRFLKSHESYVVKPRRGEQGHGVKVDIKPNKVRKTLKSVKADASELLVEQYVPGLDLRIVVIGFEVVAAATRVPPKVRSDGTHTVKQLIEKLSRRRMAATGGESKIPLDDETEKCVKSQGYSLDDIPDAGATITVRKTVNLHTGGTIRDVTDKISGVVKKAAVDAAKTLNIPVVGLDFIVPKITGDKYVIIEANERVGLANHEPQPTAQRFIDLLFPQTKTRKPKTPAGG